ncbi:hypothetical protein BDE36_1782 [Arcticibacter tournemirensis]|uniref:Uncharacterized protein n=1 Tax=Arcticibacter tournemirensis TaxID=699437 RepID=A0A5M9HEJ0_9SPHI|nr:hypothetical protein [Arcticibacter tournemirensis]KAA8483754.1 hypothetical protein F1649_07650 [Arcticibacter tournemirensis]TQM50047.1 hypothetical protein BDE36_1782 [Arcticibacter tournemirensis]
MQDYSNITPLAFEFTDGLENASGIQEQAYLIPLSFIQTEAKPVTNGTTPESLVAITTDHVLKAAKAPIEVQPLFNKSGSTTKLSGEELSKIFETDVELMIPQVTAKLIGGAAAIKNTRFILLIRRIGQTTGFWQIGCKAMPAKVQDIAGGFGVGPTAEVGLKITLKAFDVVPMYDYQGELPAPAAP